MNKEEKEREKIKEEFLERSRERWERVKKLQAEMEAILNKKR